MKKVVFVCDACGFDGIGVQELGLRCGSEPDPSGHGYLDLKQTLELCPVCMKHVLERLDGISAKPVLHWVKAQGWKPTPPERAI